MKHNFRILTSEEDAFLAGVKKGRSTTSRRLFQAGEEWQPSVVYIDGVPVMSLADVSHAAHKDYLEAFNILDAKLFSDSALLAECKLLQERNPATGWIPVGVVYLTAISVEIIAAKGKGLFKILSAFAAADMKEERRGYEEKISSLEEMVNSLSINLARKNAFIQAMVGFKDSFTQLSNHYTNVLHEARNLVSNKQSLTPVIVENRETEAVDGRG